MFCRWFNHQNLKSKFLTVFCSDSRVWSSLSDDPVWAGGGKHSPGLAPRLSGEFQPFKQEFKVCHIDKWKRVTMNFNWMFKFLSVSSMTTHNSSQNLKLTTKLFRLSVLQFIQVLPFLPPSQQSRSMAQLCWLDLRPVSDSASSVSAHYYVAGGIMRMRLATQTRRDTWGDSLRFSREFNSWWIIWHLRWSIMQSRPAATEPSLDIFTTKLTKNQWQTKTGTPLWHGTIIEKN